MELNETIEKVQKMDDDLRGFLGSLTELSRSIKEAYDLRDKLNSEFSSLSEVIRQDKARHEAYKDESVKKITEKRDEAENLRIHLQGMIKEEEKKTKQIDAVLESATKQMKEAEEKLKQAELVKMESDKTAKKVKEFASSI